MKVTEIQGDLFADLKVGDAVAHGANCRGIMGAGVAKAIKAKFPQNFNYYNQFCNRDMFKPGDIIPFQENGFVIYNLGTQYELGADAKVENVRVSVRSMVSHAATYTDLKQIKTVRLGCGIGGLDWDEVKPVLEEIPSELELIVYYF